MDMVMKFLADNGLRFEPVAFLGRLREMGIGMLVIFVIIGVIILATVLVNKLFSGSGK